MFCVILQDDVCQHFRGMALQPMRAAQQGRMLHLYAEQAKAAHQ